MNQRDEVYAALQKADAAGDTAAAKKLADYIRSMPEEHPKEKVEPVAPVTSADRVGAVGAGANRGIAGLLGLPVDTALNVWDLAKAGAGTVQGAITGKAPSEIFDPADRSKYIGSSDWISKQGDKTAVTTTQMSRPDDTASRYLYAGGAALPGALMAQPSTIGQAGSALAQNLVPALAAQGTAEATRGTQYENTAPILASLLAQGAPQAIGSLVKGGGGLTPAQENAAKAGEDIGMQLTPGQASGSKRLQQLEAKLESQPYTSGPINNIKKNNQAVLNESWVKAIGEQGKVVDSTTLDNAVQRLGDKFESFRSPNTKVIIDPAKTSATINQIDADLQGIYPGSVKDNPLVGQLEKLSQNGVIDGEQLGKLSSKLGKAAYKQISSVTGDKDYGNALYAIKDHVDDMLGTGLTKSEQADYAKTRQEWRALKQATARVNNVNPNTGNISGPNMANYLQKSDQNGFLYGRNKSPAYAATRFAQAFKPVVGDSGTATRHMGMSDLALAVPGYVGSNLYFSKPVSALAKSLSKPSMPISDARTLQYAAAQASQLTPEQRRKLSQALGGQ